MSPSSFIRSNASDEEWLANIAAHVIDDNGSPCSTVGDSESSSSEESDSDAEDSEAAREDEDDGGKAANAGFFNVEAVEESVAGDDEEVAGDDEEGAGDDEGDDGDDDDDGDDGDDDDDDEEEGGRDNNGGVDDKGDGANDESGEGSTEENPTIEDARAAFAIAIGAAHQGYKTLVDGLVTDRALNLAAFADTLDGVSFAFSSLANFPKDAWVIDRMAQPLSWLPSLQPICQDLVGFAEVRDRLMNLVALVMDPCESLQGGSDIVLETRQPGLSEEREFDWTGLISNDPQCDFCTRRGFFCTRPEGSRSNRRCERCRIRKKACSLFVHRKTDGNAAPKKSPKKTTQKNSKKRNLSETSIDVPVAGPSNPKKAARSKKRVARRSPSMSAIPSLRSPSLPLSIPAPVHRSPSPLPLPSPSPVFVQPAASPIFVQPAASPTPGPNSFELEHENRRLRRLLQLSEEDVQRERLQTELERRRHQETVVWYEAELARFREKRDPKGKGRAL